MAVIEEARGAVRCEGIDIRGKDLVIRGGYQCDSSPPVLIDLR